MIKPPNWTIVIFCFLITGAAGATGIALVSGSVFRINRFDIEVNGDTLRTQPLINLLNSYNGKLFFRVTPQQLQDSISDFKQVERVTINREGISGFSVAITLRHPLLVVTNGSKRICLGPEGIPFRNWPEHGDLPEFNVPKHIDPAQMLDPDSSIQDFYLIALHIVSQHMDNLSAFSCYMESSDFEIQLADRQNNLLLRLPRNNLRDPFSSLILVNQWLDNHYQPQTCCELDARFPGTLLVKTWKEGQLNG